MLSKSNKKKRVKENLKYIPVAILGREKNETLSLL